MSGNPIEAAPRQPATQRPSNPTGGQVQLTSRLQIFGVKARYLSWSLRRLGQVARICFWGCKRSHPKHARLTCLAILVDRICCSLPRLYLQTQINTGALADFIRHAFLFRLVDLAVTQ